jgi:hypothetical protein
LNDGRIELDWVADTIRIAADGTYAERRWLRFSETGSLTPYVVVLEGTWKSGTPGYYRLITNSGQGDSFEVELTPTGLNVAIDSPARFYTRCAEC